MKRTDGPAGTVNGDHVDDAHVVLDVNGTILHWSEAAEALFGWTSADAHGRNMMDLTVPADEHAALRQNHVIHMRHERRLVQREFAVEKIDRAGRRFPARVRVYPTGHGRNVRLHAFVDDVSGATPVGERLEPILANVNDAIARINHEDVIVSWNPAAERIFGWPRTAAVGQSVALVVPPDMIRETRALRQRVRLGEAGSISCETWRLRNGVTPVTVKLTLVRVGEANPEAELAAIYQEISDRSKPETSPDVEAVRDASAGDAGAWRPTSGTPPWISVTNPELVDRVLMLARAHLGLQVTWLSTLDDRTQTFHATSGQGRASGIAPGGSVPREDSICDRMMRGVSSHVIPDTQADPSVAHLPAVRSGRVRAYVGVPVVDVDGTVLGTLCGTSDEPARRLTERDATVLGVLAGLLTSDARRNRELAVDARRQSEVSALGALQAALDARDHYTSAHSYAVVELAEGVSRRLALNEDQVTLVGQVALLHDLGKVGIPDTILHKPGPLDPSEWALMREHPTIGARIVSAIAPLAHLSAAIGAEHERWDGSGYPAGLSGEAIPIAARITLACDAYHAMVSDRPYRLAVSHELAIAQLRENAGTQFDPAVVAELLDTLADAEGS